MARLCKGGVKLRDMVDDRWPKRDRASDGWLGDSKHAARTSDHNPNAQGIVRAIDIDENMGSGKNRQGKTAKKLADQIVQYAASTAPGAKRVKYVVYEHEIASGTYVKTWWQWRRDKDYGHTQHIHVSFTASADRDGTVWPLPILTKNPAKKLAYRRLISKRRR
jgi:hypothetical protein